MAIEINDLDAPQLEPFRSIRTRNWTEQSGIFIAEGPVIVEQLLLSRHAIRSILIDSRYKERYREWILDPRDHDVLIVDHELVEELVGYRFHRGVLGCGLREEISQSLVSLPKTLPRNAAILVLVGLQDPENLGAIIRSAVAFGVEHIIIGPGTADPLGRRALRVSAGLALKPKFHRARNQQELLEQLQAIPDLKLIATAVSPESEALEALEPDGPVAILIGNEGVGLPDQCVEAADHVVRILMMPEIDSLNAAVAAGIVMHHFAAALAKNPNES